MSKTLKDLNKLTAKEKRRLLAQKLKEKASAPKRFPLSFAQKRLWFLDKLAPNSPFFTIPFGFRVKGKLNIEALKKSLNEIVRRHEALRTTFKEINGSPVQQISPSLELNLAIHDLTDLADAEKERRAYEIALDIANRPFDLSTGPLIKTTLLKLDQNEHIYLLTQHHIVSDGWSEGVLLHEIGVLYDAYSSGRPSPLPELSIQYADFAVWQNNWLEGEVLDNLLSYWKEKFLDVPLLDLPTDYKRPVISTFKGTRSREFIISESTTAVFRDLTHGEGATLFMILLAAFYVLLYRYTGQEDIVIGTDIANRTNAEIEALIGYFVNVLALRTDLSGNPTFRELLQQVKQECLDAYAHQDLPFEKLIDELNPPRDTSRHPLFDVVFILQNAPLPKFGQTDFDVALYIVDNGTAKIDLTLYFWELRGELVGAIEYSTDIFKEETIDRMIEHFRILLEEIAINPDCPITDLPILIDTERIFLARNTNKNVKIEQGTDLIHKRFERQEKRNPDSVAIVMSGKEITYKQLNTRANKLGRYLRKNGVSSESPVAVIADRTIETIIAIMGILKADGAYVPIDPAYPSERIKYILENCGAEIVITNGNLDDLEVDNITVLSLDEHERFIERERSGNLRTENDLSNSAYIMYTSGSTGAPKGVTATHGSVMNLIQEISKTYDIESSDRILQFHTFAFDASVEEIFAALLNGATLVMSPDSVISPDRELVNLIKSKDINVVSLPTAYWHYWVEELFDSGDTLPDTLRLVIVGGEKASMEHYLKWQKLNAYGIRWINTYGPTEATVVVTCYEPQDNEVPPYEDIPIGKPIENTKIYILDDDLNPVPIGVVGEIHIGGACLARGYVNDPALTREKFISDPFSNDPGARLYKTGDLGRYLPDFNIQFIGRKDRQLKLRGFRIEPGEIESVINEHPDIDQAVVEPVKDKSGDTSLAAYFVPKDNTDNITEKISEFIKHKLPAYMIPSYLIPLDSLPLTPNGKIDRKSLPPPSALRPELQSKFIPPGTEAEKRISEILSEVLGLDRVGIKDNFFDLGGHSLLATRVVSQIRSSMDVYIPLITIFERPTVEGLAQAVDNVMEHGAGVIAPPITPFSKPKEIPIGNDQMILWDKEQTTPGTCMYNLSPSLRVKAPLNLKALEKSFNMLVERHESLRTTFSVKDGKPVQVINPDQTIKIPVIDLSDMSVTDREDEIMRLATEQIRTPFALTLGPLLRVVILKNTENDHAVLINVHHLVFDGWSSHILFRDLFSFYKSILFSQPSALPELPIQYADYTLWQRETIQGDLVDYHINYWRDKLRDLPVLEMNTDRPRPAQFRAQGANYLFKFSKVLSSSINELSLRNDATLFMTLLSSLYTVLYKYTGQDDIVIGTSLAGRNRKEIENLIGIFISSQPLRTDLSGDPKFSELLGRVRSVCLGAYAHQDMHDMKIAEELKIKKTPGRGIFYDIKLYLQNYPHPVSDVSGIDIKPLVVYTDNSHNDFSIFMFERDGVLFGDVLYDTDLFNRPTIVKLIKDFKSVLEHAVEYPETHISDFPI